VGRHKRVLFRIELVNLLFFGSKELQPEHVFRVRAVAQAMISDVARKLIVQGIKVRAQLGTVSSQESSESTESVHEDLTLI